MKSLYPMVLLALGLLFSLSSCQNDDDSEEVGDSKLIMTFDPRFDGSEIQLNERAVNIHQCTFEVTSIKFYIANIKLHSSAGTEVFLKDIALIDIPNNKRSLEFIVPAGDYEGVSFDLGVPQNMNGTGNPDFSTSIYGPEHPLSISNGMYWQWASGYRFFTFEGRFDTIPQATGNLPLTFAFHTGLDTLFRSVPRLDKRMEMHGGSTFHLPVSISIDSLFATHADTLNLHHVRTFHGSPGQLDVGIRAANNTSRSFIVD